LALEIPDVSADRCTIIIRQSIWNGVLQSPKTRNGFRDVDLCTELAALLKKLIGNRQTGFVLRTANGRPLSASNILQRDLHEILEQAGIAQAGFHSFRRYRVAYLRKSRVPEDLLRFWIGHADKSVTDGYSKLKEDVEFRKTTAEQIGLGFEIPMQKTALLSECPKTQILAVSASC
jgi:integrase